VAKSLHDISAVTKKHLVDWNAKVAGFTHLLKYHSLSPFLNLYHPHSFLCQFTMDGFDARKSGSGRFNKNEPFGNNPFISIPADVDRAPFRLVWIDILSVFSLSKLLLLIINPLWPCISGPLDELSPTWSNLKDVFLQGVLIISQVLLFVTLPIVAVLYWFLPGVIHLLYLTAFAVVTLIVTRLLNGGPRAESLVGLPDSLKPVNDEHELWFFINGIATGYVLERRKTASHMT
jgi:hypothetical protein